MEEAFSHFTTELEGDIDILPPPPNTADDAADDWQYQLPAPPTAFRDSSSPTLTAGETIDISSAQVSHSLLSNHQVEEERYQNMISLK